jgi:hypothetical protein
MRVSPGSERTRIAPQSFSTISSATHFHLRSEGELYPLCAEHLHHLLLFMCGASCKYDAIRRSPMPSPLRTGYLTSSSKNLPYSRTRSASVNGLEMYYEIHGSGPPLVVLHGAYITIETMGEICRGYLGPCRPIPGRKRYRDVRTRLPGATRVGREWFPSSGWCRPRGQR